MLNDFGCVRCSNGATKEGRTTHSWQSYDIWICLDEAGIRCIASMIEAMQRIPASFRQVIHFTTNPGQYLRNGTTYRDSFNEMDSAAFRSSALAYLGKVTSKSARSFFQSSIKLSTLLSESFLDDIFINTI